MPDRTTACTPAGLMCVRPGESLLTREEADVLASGLKALADPVRLQIVAILAAQPGHEACVCDLTPALKLSQPTVSHHLKVLRDAGLVTREARGTWAWFHLNPQRLTELADQIAAAAPAPTSGGMR
ncbi:MAG: ArsR/SmtB family transcription factor [Nostocoides sp.]